MDCLFLSFDITESDSEFEIEIQLREAFTLQRVLCNIFNFRFKTAITKSEITFPVQKTLREVSWEIRSFSIGLLL